MRYPVKGRADCQGGWEIRRGLSCFLGQAWQAQATTSSIPDGTSVQARAPGQRLLHGPSAWAGAITLSFMLCCHCLEILDNF